MLDREIPQIERLAKRKQGEQQKPIGLAGGRQKELGLHGSAHYAPRTLAAQPAARGTKRKTARVRSPGESAQTRDRQFCEKGRFGDGARSRIPPFPTFRQLEKTFHGLSKSPVTALVSTYVQTRGAGPRTVRRPQGGDAASRRLRRSGRLHRRRGSCARPRGLTSTAPSSAKLTRPWSKVAVAIPA